jgi:hypothetical protein
MIIMLSDTTGSDLQQTYGQGARCEYMCSSIDPKQEHPLDPTATIFNAEFGVGGALYILRLVSTTQRAP